MKRNFEFDHFTIIRWNGTTVDLHGDYDLESFGTDLGGGEVTMSFIRNEHAFAPNETPSKVSLRCAGNVRVAFNDLSAIAAPLNQEGIEIAYFDADCDWLSFLDEDLARRQEPQGLHVSFINGFALRVFCDEVTFSAH